MDLAGKVVIHKVWGKSVVMKHESSVLYVVFNQEEKRFSYPDSFESFLKFEDPNLQDEAMRLLHKKDEEKRKEMANWHTTTTNAQVKQTPKINQKKPVEKNNIVFKCNYCDGGKDKKHIGFMGACSDEMIRYNIEVAQHRWCTDPECPCNQYYYGEIDGTALDSLCSQGDSPCYESVMLCDWSAFAGTYLSGDKKYVPKKINNIQIGSLAILTTRMPHKSEEDRIVFGVFLVDEGAEGNGTQSGWVRSESKYRIELHPAEAQKIKFWRYHANETNPDRAVWGTGLYRYIKDVEAAQMLRDIVSVKKDPYEKRFAEEFLAHYCKTKGINITEIAKPNGAIK